MSGYDALLDAGRTGCRCPVCGDDSGSGEPCSDACAHAEYLRDAADDWERDDALANDSNELDEAAE